MPGQKRKKNYSTPRGSAVNNIYMFTLIEALMIDLTKIM